MKGMTPRGITGLERVKWKHNGMAQIKTYIQLVQEQVTKLFP
jgi:hypothetical protein